MGVQRFEDLIVWQHAREYCAQVARLTNRPAFFRQHVLQERMDKTAMSIVENIAEGFERESRREFAQFLKVARGSTAEARAQLYLAKDRNLLQERDFEQLFEIITGIGKMLRRLRVTVLQANSRPVSVASERSAKAVASEAQSAKAVTSEAQSAKAVASETQSAKAVASEAQSARAAASGAQSAKTVASEAQSAKTVASEAQSAKTVASEVKLSTKN